MESNCNYCKKSVVRKPRKDRKNLFCTKECYWVSIRTSYEEQLSKLKKRLNTLYDVDSKGCWIWNKCTYVEGYGQLTLYKKRTRAHRLSWEIFKGPIPKGMLVCHKCDVRPCINPDHLFIGTYSDNLRDAFKKGRRFRRSSLINNKRKTTMLSPKTIKKVEEMRDELKAINKFRKEMGLSELEGDGIYEYILKEERETLIKKESP